MKYCFYFTFSLTYYLDMKWMFLDYGSRIKLK